VDKISDSDKQTEERIFEAATEVFVLKGMEGARMQDIADHAGINKALLHYYFRSKDHLFDAVFQNLARKIFEKFAPVFEEKLSLEEKIRFFYREHISFLQENPLIPAFILNEVNRNPVRVKKLLGNIEFHKLWSSIYKQHKYELKNYDINERILPQVMISIAALSVFPFAARGILEVIFENAGINFNEFIEQRKEFAAKFVIKAIKEN
jgi:TetR/AcrR family transcriptional regulator